MSADIAAVAQWRAEQRARSAFACTEVPLDALARWQVGRDDIAHVTGGFFRIIAVRTASSEAAIDGEAQPFILQPEIGILGFLARAGANGPQLLVQAKTEPGNAGAVQLAPSFQCTPSNYTARHGGTPAPFFDHFAAPPPGGVISDLRQSEQGTRFLGKFNRNMVVELPAGTAPEGIGPAWRWLDAAALRALLVHDNVLNTDARSVLVSTPWRYWAGGESFARWRGAGGFGAALLRSYRHAEADDPRAWLLAQRAATSVTHARLALADLPGWRMSDGALAPTAPGGFAVRGYRVQARDREVANWDQPLVDSAGDGEITLICQERDGVMRVLLRARAEAGLGNRVEIAASVQIAPGALPERGIEAELAAAAESGIVHLACHQSEEGGRFHRDGNAYRVVELDEAMALAPPAAFRWVTLRQLEALCTTPGLVTNEARSVASLLLSLV